MKKVLVIGSLNMDFVMQVPHMPLAGETILSGSFELVPGGKGANQAYALGKLGGKVAMLGAVGADEYGRMLKENLRTVGVDVSQLKTAGNAHTGSAFIAVDESGDNSIIVVPGAGSLVDKAYIDEHLALLAECDIVVFQLEIPMETVCYAAKKAKELGKLVILDPAPAPAYLPEELLRCVDIIKPNEVELASLAGNPCAENNLQKSAEALRARGAGTVVVTLGGEGAYLFDGVNECRFPADKCLQVVDTTAAGDSFTAAMALYLSQDKSLEQAIAFAVKVGGIVVTRKGAQTSIPSIEEIEKG